MCEHLPALGGETFPDQVRRWYEALHFMAGLNPRTSLECLLAADVSMKNQFMLEVLARGRGPAARQRQQRSREFISRARDMQAAQLQYEMLRAQPAD